MTASSAAFSGSLMLTALICCALLCVHHVHILLCSTLALLPWPDLTSTCFTRSHCVPQAGINFSNLLSWPSKQCDHTHEQYVYLDNVSHNTGKPISGSFPVWRSPTPACYSSFSSVSHITHSPWSSTPRDSLLSFHNLFLVNVTLYSTQFCCPGAEASAVYCWVLTAVCLSYMMKTIALIELMSYFLNL